MPRKAPGALVYHVLNRASGRLRLFRKDEDYLAFEQVLAEAHGRVPIRILGWCLLPDHWHLVLWPKRDRELSDFMRWLTLTHAQRWKHAHDAVGGGHLYRDRFKSFPIQQDHHVLDVLRYVEANGVRPTLARRAERWAWGSAFVRQSRSHELRPLLAEWPVPRPGNWLKLLNAPFTDAERKLMQEHIARSRPMGEEAWVKRTAKAVGAEQSLRPRGRPPGWRKSTRGSSVDSGVRHLEFAPRSLARSAQTGSDS